MAKGNCTFRKSDVTRLLSAAEKAGVKVARVEVEAGKLTLVPEHDGAIPEGSKPNEWDNAR
jgi:hypothetical protein